MFPGNLNTPDPMDAWFGIVGTLVGFLLLAFLSRFGLTPNPAWEGSVPPTDEGQEEVPTDR